MQRAATQSADWMSAALSDRNEARFRPGSRSESDGNAAASHGTARWNGKDLRIGAYRLTGPDAGTVVRVMKAGSFVNHRSQRPARCDEHHDAVALTVRWHARSSAKHHCGRQAKTGNSDRPKSSGSRRTTAPRRSRRTSRSRRRITVTCSSRPSRRPTRCCWRSTWAARS